MSLTDQINQDIKAAMLAREKEKLAALRAIKAVLILEATKGSESSPEDEMKAVQKLHKQRIDAADIYKDNGRDDLEKEERLQADVISVYLPAQMSEEDVAKVVQEVIAQTGASGPSDMGKVMGAAMGKLNGKADGKVISSIVKSELTKA